MPFSIYIAIWITQICFTKLVNTDPQHISGVASVKVFTPRFLVRSNRPATLPCKSNNNIPLVRCTWESLPHASNLEPFKIIWYDGEDHSEGGKEEIEDSEEIEENEFSFVGSGLRKGECGLQILNVTLRHIGQWTCILEATNGTVLTEVTRTELIESPESLDVVETNDNPPVVPNEIRNGGKEGGGANTNVFVYVAIAFTIVFGCVAMGIKIWRDRKRIRELNEKIRDLTKEELDEFYKGSGHSEQDDAHAHIYSLPFKGEFEIPRERLVICRNKILGSGEFGLVKQGSLLTQNDLMGTDLTVAVKMVKPHVEVSHFIALLLEIKILGHLGRHINIVSLMGAVTDKIKDREVFVALEFCAKGDLLRHLRKYREPFSNLWSQDQFKTGPEKIMQKKNKEGERNISVALLENASSNVQDNSAISTLNLLNWSHQISNGMAYLHSKVIHGDLAARNILLSEEGIAKISDFGLSRQLINYSNYSKNTESPLPWRWLAIESLTDRMFSLQSDIWSFGVTLWEIFTLGQVPYSEKVWDTEFLNGLKDGQRLEPPQFGNQEIYQLMLNCTKRDPAQRITFQEIMTELKSLGARPVTCERRISREAHYIKLNEENVN